MPSPVGHAMAGLITAWVGEVASGRAGRRPARDRRGEQRSATKKAKAFVGRLAESVTPLAVACAVLAISPDFDNFFHTHRTWSHSLGAAAIVWAIVALVAWSFRWPVLSTATTCAAAYASHVLLDWLGSDEGPNGGLMALWPLSSHFYKSGANLFLELMVHPRANLVRLFVRNIPAFAREVAILLPPLVAVWLIRVKPFSRLATEVTSRHKAA